ncbi:MAG TPA: sulfurase [Amaricoccus sp.]|nr:sulfurase [Amaricoccus sp.]
MAILSATGLGGRVAWLGLVRDRAASLRAAPVGRVEARLDGFEGESHSGPVRRSCSRVAALHPKGTTIRNSRQVTILSREEMAVTAAAMGLPVLAPEWVGANLVLEGLPDLTLVPPSSRLQFDSGATLVVDMENAPCQFPAREIDAEHPGLGAGYRRAARHRRGVTAWVEREGAIALGDLGRLFVPPVRLYPPLARVSEAAEASP